MSMGVNPERIVMINTHSIEVYFLCDTEAELNRLEDHYYSGLMKTVLELTFSLLADESDNSVTITQLHWRTHQPDDSLLISFLFLSFSDQLLIGC